jgi:hypothetical protein
MMLERQLAELLEGTTDAASAVDLQGEVRTWKDMEIRTRLAPEIIYWNV